MNDVRRRIFAPQNVWVVLVVALAGAVSASGAAVGADARWLAALGASIVSERAIPDGVPYAVAPTSGWDNILVAAEVGFHALVSAADERGLAIAQVLAVVAGFTLLARDARRAGASEAGTSVALALVMLGALGALVVVRLQLFSLVLFPLVLLLLRADERRPHRRIWVLPVIFAAWSNLHGAALLGIAVVGAYLLVDRARRRPLESVALLAASLLGLFVTPALWHTADYYRGVLENEAARRGVGLWAPITLTAPLDLLLVVSAAGMLVLVARGRPRLWEIVALVGIALLTLQTARTGVWLLFTAVGPAARGLTHVPRPRPRITVPVTGALVVVLMFALVRGPLPSGASDRVLARALGEAAGTPIIAEPIEAEQVVLRGGRVWIANPIDAFRRKDQAAYLDWLDGDPSGDVVLVHAQRVVIVRRGSDAAKRIARRDDFGTLTSDDRTVVYRRR